MKPFSFAVMGAGNIAVKFCDAVMQIPEAAVIAAASKSLDRAKTFAEKNNITAYYDSYKQMLEQEKPDCVYIATTPNSHYALAMLCLDHGVPVLCEKAMFLNSTQAKTVFQRAAEKKVFVMEAMWSRFLPMNQQAKKWIEAGKIGDIQFLEAFIGFKANTNPKNRYLNPDLGGGARFDLLVYAYELARYFISDLPSRIQASAVWGASGVDLTDHIMLTYPKYMASLTASFVMNKKEQLTIYGTKGKIEVPYPHFAEMTLLYGEDGSVKMRERDTITKNGFVYELAEVISCIRAGKIESQIVPHRLTIDCAEVFDLIQNDCAPKGDNRC